MMLGPVVRGVHEDPQRDGSTGTPITIIVMSSNGTNKLTKFMRKMLPAFTLVLWLTFDPVGPEKLPVEIHEHPPLHPKRMAPVER